MAAEAITQTGRWLTLTTPLGPDVLLPIAFTGEEGFSTLFRFEIEAVSTNTGITGADLLGQSVTLTVKRLGDATRPFNGVVTGFAAGAMVRRDMRAYRLEVRPSFALLGYRSDVKIFQDKSAKDIITAVLSDSGLSAYEFKLNATPAVREYCVQYNETNLDFIARLLEEEGIFYFFKHAVGSHTLVMADNSSAFYDSADASAVFRENARPGSVCLRQWEAGWDFRSGKRTLRDYNFLTPTTDLTATVSTVLKITGAAAMERYSYPGLYIDKDTGTAIAKRQLEIGEGSYLTVRGSGAYADYSPGAKFTLDEHPVEAEQGKGYVLATVRHQGRDDSYLGTAGGAAGSGYSNDFTCLPDSATVRPPIVTPKPIVRGPQTAKVVGPSGEEIYCDANGRIKVQFPWDRVGTNDEKSSCWMRVAQSWAGNGWGTWFLPRIGMEVVVEFLEGNPDRPLVTGAVYNGTNALPYSLPDNKTQSGIKTRSSAQGAAADANELRFEDKKGSEQILFHAQKDFLREVENDDTLTVDHDQTITVKNNRSLTVSEGNETHTVSKGNQTIAVSTGKQTVTVESDQATTVKTGNHSLTVSTGNSTTTVAKGNMTVGVDTGNLTTTVAKGNYSLSTDLGNQSFKASTGKVSIEATGGISLTCGANSIEISQSGITINGMKVSIQGSMQAEVKGAMTTVSGDGMLTLKGGMVMIN